MAFQVLSLDTIGYSFGHVASWAGGGKQAIAGINGSCERIQRAAEAVLQSFEVEQTQATQAACVCLTADNERMPASPDPLAVVPPSEDVFFPLTTNAHALVTGSPSAAFRPA
jgi:hypothetical protein